MKAQLRPIACIHCRHFELACTHPAVTEVKVSPISGNTKIIPVDAEVARAESGICGPEAALFDPRSVPGQIAVAVITSRSGQITLVLAALLVGALLFA